MGSAGGVFVFTKMERQLPDWDQAWEFIQNGISNLKRTLDGSSEPQFNLEEDMMIYSTIYTLCMSYDYSEELFEKYQETIEEYIDSTVLPSLSDKHDELVLQEIAKRWEKHKFMVKRLAFYFRYLDRYYIPNHRPLPCLRRVGFNCFLPVSANARAVVLGLIHKKREGDEQIDGVVLKKMIDIYVEIGDGDMDAYQVEFEAHMLKETGEYYSPKASTWIVEDSFLEYMLKVEECLRRERDGICPYLHSSSEKKLVEKVKHEFLVVYAKQLLENEQFGFRALLRDEEVKSLSMTCKLYYEMHGCMEYIASLFKQHILMEGLRLVQQAEDASNSGGRIIQKKVVVVRKIVELHDKYMPYIYGCFMNHSLFHIATKNAFKEICDKSVAECSSAECLALFCDDILRKGVEATEEELFVDKVINLIPYICDKNLFAEFYRKKLARRLLSYRSVNMYHEKSVLSNLMRKCASQCNKKMEGMVRDFTLAREIQTDFEEYLHNNPNVNLGMDLTVTVLTTGFWPNYKSFDFLHLPSPMMDCVEVFKGFYKTKTKNRKLRWILSLGTCNITAKFEPKEIELVVSTSQGIVLMLFNTADKWSYSELLTQLNVDHDDLVRILHSLSCGKYKILMKEPNTKTISQNDNFEVNSMFTDRRRRIKLPLPPPPMDERKEVFEEDVDIDRRYAIDAAIVRTMKFRQAMSHGELVMECLDKLAPMFKPDAQQILKRVEDLILREYLEMDRELNVVFYLA